MRESPWVFASARPRHLGELLRYVSGRVDQGAAERYETLKIDYRPRYTPLLRALAAGAETVTEITSNSSLTQGAISQTVSLMLKGGLLARRGLDDGRKTGLRLTKKGVALLTTLEPHRQMTFLAIRSLELEIGYPVLAVLQALGAALEREGFASRLKAAPIVRRRRLPVAAEVGTRNWFDAAPTAYALFRPDYGRFMERLKEKPSSIQP